MKNFVFSLIFVLINFQDIFAQKPCARRDYDGAEPQMMCMCNSTYCDEFPQLGTLSRYQVAVYTSSISGKRFERTNLTFDAPQTPSSKTIGVTFDASEKFQIMVGFGAAFTETAGQEFMRLSEATQATMMHALFGEEGIEYTLGRVPICDEGCDNVDGDFELEHFDLCPNDYKYKIPMITSAKQLAKELRLFASPWSAPAWMKTNHMIDGQGGFSSTMKGDLNGPYYKTWANYFIKFFEAYAQNNVTFWGVTVQNEPVSGVTSPWGAMYMSAEMHRDFVKGILGPVLRNHPLTKDIFLMVMDDQRWLLPGFAQTVLSDPEAAKYIDGIAVHWYEDFLADPKATLGKTHELFPNHTLFASEACNGYLPLPGLNQQVFGDWARAVAYMSDIIDDIQNWVTGWMDWMICLNEYSGNDSPIIINRTVDEFYKQPMYYALGHFSKFVRPNSIRVGLSFDREDNLHPKNDLDGVAFETPSNQNVIVLQNRNMTFTYRVQISDFAIAGKAIDLIMEPRSFVTLVWDKTT